MWLCLQRTAEMERKLLGMTLTLVLSKLIFLFDISIKLLFWSLYMLCNLRTLNYAKFIQISILGCFHIDSKFVLV